VDAKAAGFQVSLLHGRVVGVKKGGDGSGEMPAVPPTQSASVGSIHRRLGLGLHLGHRLSNQVHVHAECLHLVPRLILPYLAGQSRLGTFWTCSLPFSFACISLSKFAAVSTTNPEPNRRWTRAHSLPTPELQACPTYKELLVESNPWAANGTERPQLPSSDDGAEAVHLYRHGLGPDPLVPRAVPDLLHESRSLRNHRSLNLQNRTVSNELNRRTDS
jgi:hypothetical protein